MTGRCTQPPSFPLRRRDRHAGDAIQFAQAAIKEAEYAVLDAVLARKDADVLAAAT